ncbi:DUF974 hypothetical protein [Helicosporidium sp. ATCC 50920]|nr:DUF974 hypothetical protein [Helicosporidium sp. ATCC 50920]|eukprot:KDD76427.1 DUF974 hypothetical protein [Helicosporidium sp. ATCC 50920]
MAEGGELVFRIMRLCHPSLELSTGLRVDLDRDMGAGLWESSVAEGSGAGSDPAPETMSVALDFSERVDLGASAGGLTGQLSFPQSFGTVCLGQTFSAAVTLCNQGDLPVTAVGIKVELQTERSKITLHDTTGSPVQSLPPGGRAELGVSLDVREVGPHTLTCSALFTDSGGGRQFKPQHFRFAALNPLLVRTKHRLVEDGPLLLELTLENATRAPLLLAGLRFLPEPGCSAVQLGEDASLDDGCVDGGAMESPRGPLASYIERLPVLEPAGGTWGAIFAMEHPRRLAGQAGGEMPLGRIDIRWRATLGESARLQTQSIALAMPPPREVRARLVHTPADIRPFALEGEQEVALAQALAPGSSRQVSLSLVALEPGQSCLPPVHVHDERTGALLDSTLPWDVWVLPP